MQAYQFFAAIWYAWQVPRRGREMRRDSRSFGIPRLTTPAVALMPRILLTNRIEDKRFVSGVLNDLDFSVFCGFSDGALGFSRLFL